jgi:(methylthio)acryloyl-CoA hydratase
MALELPSSLAVEHRGAVSVLTLNRAEKRNALNDPTVAGIQKFFTNLPAGTKAVVLAANGPHFCAGLDLSELMERTTFEGMTHSRSWHEAFRHVQFGSVPVIAAMQGAVIGGGLEIATIAHLRVADSTTYYALPEGSRGLFVGGGASVRVQKLIGTHMMSDMMLTGRKLSALEGHTLGLTNYLVDEGQALTKALELAEIVAQNSPVTNYAVMHVLPRIGDVDPETGYMMESLMAAISSGSPEAMALMEAFLAGKGKKVTR